MKAAAKFNPLTRGKAEFFPETADYFAVLEPPGSAIIAGS
jgi:hypothetical protein